ncbi:hypothetical protein ACFQ1S_22265, partial [Kibdelosporangium lantanae]
MTQRIRLSSAAYWAWGLAGVMLAMTAFHIWAITETPETSLYWVAAVADLVVAIVAFGLGLQWPRYALFEADGVILARQRIRYESITALRLGDVSAKPFWLAFWFPTSLVGGLIVALVPKDTFNREVVEVVTENRTARFRWKNGNTVFVDALQARRPDLERTYHLDGHSYARDFTPRMGVGGGLLAACLGVWVAFTALTTPDLFDLSTQRGPYPLAATQAKLRSITAELRDYAPLPGVPTEFSTETCSRKNVSLGPSPDVVDLSIKIVARDMPPTTADAIENHLRDDTGMLKGEYYHPIYDADSNIAIDIPEVHGLYIEISTGCVRASDVDSLRGDLTKVAAALGVG